MKDEEVVVLASTSHSTDGCDRVVLAGGQIIVQGKACASYPAGTPMRVPPGEVLNAISADVLLDAAHELERRRGLEQ